MAETRKHHIAVRDELDKALYAALGQPVRPVEPGPKAADSPQAVEAEPAASDDEPAHERHRSATSTFVTPGSTLAGFTFGHANPPDAG